jgi:DNA polymerase-3 subunit epsilon
MLREIVLDTETTGLDPRKGDRVIELGCVELIDRSPSGREFHRFINPDGRPIPAEATRIHGITDSQLVGKPVFREVVGDFLAFIGEAPLVIHNADFDLGFLNAELALVSAPAIAKDRVIDTLALARRKHPAGPNSLDALCKRYGIDASDRTRHGAIIDSLLLAKIYAVLVAGDRQATLGLTEVVQAPSTGAVTETRPAAAVRQRPAPLPPRLGARDEEAHRAFVEQLGANAIWKRFGPTR